MLFLSHSSCDKAFVRFLSEDLISCGHHVWLDERELRPGDRLSPSLTKAIETSSTMIMFLSVHSVQSKWVEFEIDVASHIRQKKNRPFLIPCLLGEIRDIDLPPFALDVVYVDLRNPVKYEAQMEALLKVVAVPGATLRLPPFDGDRSDRYVAQAAESSLKGWLLDFISGSIRECLDSTARYWMYITLAEVGGRSVATFLADAMSVEVGFAKRGVEEALRIIGESPAPHSLGGKE